MYYIILPLILNPADSFFLLYIERQKIVASCACTFSNFKSHKNISVLQNTLNLSNDFTNEICTNIPVSHKWYILFKAVQCITYMTTSGNLAQSILHTHDKCNECVTSMV